MSKPWIELNSENIAAVPGQLGVFEVADEAETIIKIAYAGGRELFGMRSALTTELERLRQLTAEAVKFRYELNHGYLTRWEELLMVYQAQHGSLPIGNADHNETHSQPLGRLMIDPGSR